MLQLSGSDSRSATQLEREKNVFLLSKYVVNVLSMCYQNVLKDLRNVFLVSKLLSNDLLAQDCKEAAGIGYSLPG